jgi:hypothetical protein
MLDSEVIGGVENVREPSSILSVHESITRSHLDEQALSYILVLERT